MALSVNTSGSLTATGSGTEDTLATVTSANVFNLEVDLNSMADGTTPDIVIIKAYSKARTGDTERLEQEYHFIGLQTLTLFRSLPVVSPHSVKYTLTQVQGGTDAFPWAIYQAQ